MADLGDQLKAQLEINKALKERQSLLESNSKIMRQQSDIAAAMCKSLDCKNLKNLEKDAGSFKGAIKDASDSAREQLGLLNEKSEETSNAFDKIYKKAAKLATASSFFKGFGKGVSLAFGAITSLGKAVTGVIGSLFKLGKSILMVPFQILGGLISMANKGGISPFRKALEELRKELGDFSKGPAAATKDAVYSIRRSFNDSKSSAVSFGRIFGYGREGMAKALQDTLELAKGMGPVFESFITEIGKGIGDFTKYQKGLGLSGEEAGKFAVKMRASGKDVNKAMHEIGNMAIQLGDQFNLSSKGIGRDIVQMTNSMEHFGGMSRAEMGALSVTMRRTGIEMKTLQGIVDHFDNFENAARSAAILRRQFGMMIDSRKMMTMNAGERQEYLREQFKKTGRSFEDMDRIEKKAFAANLKMSVQEAAIMFGKGNRQKKLTDAQKAANKAQANQIAQTKVLQQLTKNIERQFQQGSTYASFWAAFTGGIEKGVRRTEEFRRLMRNLRKGLRIVERAGIRIGKAFVRSFPGVKDLLGSISKFFSPGRLGPNMMKVSNAFDRFFKSLQDPKQIGKALNALIAEVKSIFANFFGGADGKAFAKASDAFSTTIGNIKLLLLQKATESAATFIDGFASGLNKLLGNKNPLGGAADDIGNGFNERFGENFDKLKKVFEEKLLPALERAWPVVKEGLGVLYRKIKEELFTDENIQALKDGFKAAFGFLGDVFRDIWKEHGGKIIAGATVFLFPGLVMGLLKAAGTYFVSTLAPAFGSLLLTTLLDGIVVFGASIGTATAGAAAAAVAGIAGLALSMVNGIVEAFSQAFDGFLAGDGWGTILGKFAMGFAGGITEVLSLGFFDADEMMDSVFGGTRVLDKYLKERAEADKAAIENFRKTVEPDRKALKDLMSMKEFDEFSQKQDQAAMIRDRFKAGLEDAKGTFFNSDMKMAVDDLDKTAQRQLQLALKKGLSEAEQSMIKFENGMLVIDDDLYAEKGKHLEAAIANFAGGKEAYATKVQELEKEAAKQAEELQGQNTILDKTIAKASALAAAQKPPLTEADIREEKLAKLEAAQDTIKKLKELEKVPAELETAKAAFDKIDEDSIQDKITTVFVKVGKMSGVITDAIKAAGLETTKSIISPAVMTNFESIKEAREVINAVIGNKTVSKSLVAARKDNITTAFTAVGEIHKALGEVAFGSLGTGVYEKLIDVKMSAAEIVGENGLFNQYKVQGLTRKIKGTTEAVAAINKLAQDLQKVPELVAVLNVGEGFTQGKDIKIELTKHNIDLKVQVNLDAKKFVKEIVTVDFDQKGVTGKQRLMSGPANATPTGE